MEAYREAWKAKFGQHLSEEAIRALPGLTDEVREACVAIAVRGVLAPEVRERWHLRLRMDPKVADEFGKEAIAKMIKDGREGRVLLLTSAVNSVLVEDDERPVMIAKMIRVVKTDLRGNPTPEGRFCVAQIDANTVAVSDGTPGAGSIRSIPG